jgi:class 3 adenylate cyclase
MGWRAEPLPSKCGRASQRVGGAVGTETLGVLFTDLVGSTELLTRLGEERADQLRREHFRLLRAALGAHSGREVKNVGDGLMVVFQNASSAVAGAVAMQQRTEAHSRAGNGKPLSIRVGVSYGECDVDDGDYFGPPVVEAARLCAAASPSQILVSDIVRALAGTRGGHAFTARGSLTLKGFETPVTVMEVGWMPWPAEPGLASLVPVPVRLRAGPGLGFVGRARERARIGDALKQAESMHQRRLVLVAGEAGIGKTSLAAEVAREASASGAVVLYGRCDDELGIPYQPWAEALQHLVAYAPAELLAEHVAARGGELARLVPELAGRVGMLPESRSADPETERYLLFGAVLDLLGRVSADEPVVLVLDDLHWADKPSLLLLRHLMTATVPLRVLVLGAYRGTDLKAGHALGDLLAALHREEGTERLELSGLGDDEVVELLETAAGHDLDPDAIGLAHALYRETDGNPFFAGEILRHLVESGAIVQGRDGRWVAEDEFRGRALPSSAREVIGRRVAQLGGAAEQVLRAAAVIGRDFELGVLARVTELDDGALLDVMEAASAAALVSEVASVPDRFTFAHALIEHALYEDLSASRRARLHRRVAESIEQVCGDAPGDRVGELAYHWARATAPKEPDKAIQYARDAGDRALNRLAPDEAVRWFQQAIELLDPEPEDKEIHCSLLVRLGDAQRQAGDPNYRETLLDAAARARQAGATDLVVRAALANSRGFFSTVGHADDERIALLETARALLGDEQSASRARLLALLAQELVPTGNLARRQQLSDEAVRIARSLGDLATLVEVLNLRHNAIVAPETLAERCTVTAEAVLLADELGDPVARYFAETFRAFASLDAGDRDELDRAARTAMRLADEVRQPVPQWVATWERSLLAWLDGDLEQAEQHALAAFALGFDSGQPDAALVPGALLMFTRWCQDRADEIEPMLIQLAADTPDFAGLQAGVAVMQIETGRDDEARGLVDAEVATGFAGCRDDPYRLNTLVLWSHAIAALDHAAAARMLLPALGPYRDQIGNAAIVVSGPAATAIGQLHAVLGNFDDADQAFREGVTAAQRLRAPFPLALTNCWWARMLLRRDNTGDRDRARCLLDDALDSAGRSGFVGIERRVRALLAQSSETHNK